MFRIAAPAAHHVFPLIDPLPPLAEQLLGAEINKIPHTLVCGILVRVVIQHFSKNTVISMVLGHPNSEITCIPPS